MTPPSRSPGQRGPGDASYLVDLGGRRALVVGPERDPGKYLATAGARGPTIADTAETHPHADFVSGSGLTRNACSLDLIVAGRCRGTPAAI